MKKGLYERRAQEEEEGGMGRGERLTQWPPTVQHVPCHNPREVHSIAEGAAFNLKSCKLKEQTSAHNIVMKIPHTFVSIAKTTRGIYNFFLSCRPID